MKILDKNFKQFKCVIRDKTAYVGGQDFCPKLRFSCSVATALQRFVPPCLCIHLFMLDSQEDDDDSVDNGGFIRSRVISLLTGCSPNLSVPPFPSHTLHRAHSRTLHTLSHSTAHFVQNKVETNYNQHCSMLLCTNGRH